jgi:hypothetical protein
MSRHEDSGLATFQTRMIRRPLTREGTKRAAALLAAAVLGASALVVSGCGSSSSNSSSDNGSDPVAMAATRSTSVSGYRMTMNMQISSPALPSALTATGNGTFDIKDKAGTFSLAMDLGSIPQAQQALGGSTLRIDELLKWPVIYMKLPAAIAGQLASSGKPWIKIDVTKAAAAAGVPGLSSLTSNPASSDPSQMLQYLRAVSGDISNQGSEQIGGLDTTHYKATIDLNKVPDALPASARAAARQSIPAMVKLLGKSTLPVEVWIDNQHLVRQMKMSFGSSSQGQSATIGMTIDIPEYGPQPAPVLPSPDQVSDASSLLGGGTTP